MLNNYEEQLKQKDERIALLEYELRLAREDAVTLQMELRRLQVPNLERYARGMERDREWMLED